MARQQRIPLRAFTEAEKTTLERMARSGRERADHVARARALLAVAEGAPFTVAAAAVGVRSGDTVARWVARFNTEGLPALERGHGGGPAVEYGSAQAERILREFVRPPDRERDGTATWSLTTLKRALRTAPDGLPQVSTWTILRVLHAAGYTWQNSRTWCETGRAVRKRKSGTVRVTDPEATVKRAGSSEPTE
jgi:transposase